MKCVLYIHMCPPPKNRSCHFPNKPCPRVSTSLTSLVHPYQFGLAVTHGGHPLRVAGREDHHVGIPMGHPQSAVLYRCGVQQHNANRCGPIVHALKRFASCLLCMHCRGGSTCWALSNVREAHAHQVLWGCPRRAVSHGRDERNEAVKAAEASAIPTHATIAKPGGTTA